MTDPAPEDATPAPEPPQENNASAEKSKGKDKEKKDKSAEKLRYPRKTPEEVMHMLWPKDRKFDRDMEAVGDSFLPDNVRYEISTNLSNAATNLEKVPITPELERVAGAIKKVYDTTYHKVAKEIAEHVKEKMGTVEAELKKPSEELGALFEGFLKDARKKDRKEEKKRRKKHKEKKHKKHKKDKHKSSKKHKKDKEEKSPKKEGKDEKEYERNSSDESDESDEEGEEDDSSSSDTSSKIGFSDLV